MSSEAKLQNISLEECAELRDLYRVDWPRYAYTFYMLENFYNWRDLLQNGEVEVFTDPERDWRITGTFVLKDCKELFFYTLDTTVDSLEKVLRTVMSKLGAPISMVYDSCFRTVVDRSMCMLSYAKDSHERMVCYRQLVPHKDGKDMCNELQSEYRFGAVKPEDSVIVEQQWVHNDPIFTNLPTRLIERNPSLAVYDTNDRLVAWCLIDQTGSLALFQTIPEHRRKGLGRAIIERLSNQLHENGQLPQAYVVDSNVASRSLFEKLGFNAVELWHWIKVNKQES
uniref:Glycine N-acyltransferase-like protein n=1 Tax=Anopheles funestus TaxID=62324 RepID=A0A1Y9HDK5_ANOFN